MKTVIKEEIQMSTEHEKALVFVTLGMVELTQGEKSRGLRLNVKLWITCRSNG